MNRVNSRNNFVMNDNSTLMSFIIIIIIIINIIINNVSSLKDLSTHGIDEEK